MFAGVLMDDDGDGDPNVTDPEPLNPLVHNTDTDGDGAFDSTDIDDDGDGIELSLNAQPALDLAATLAASSAVSTATGGAVNHASQNVAATGAQLRGSDGSDPCLSCG